MYQSSNNYSAYNRNYYNSSYGNSYSQPKPDYQNYNIINGRTTGSGITNSNKYSYQNKEYSSHSIVSNNRQKTPQSTYYDSKQSSNEKSNIRIRDIPSKTPYDYSNYLNSKKYDQEEEEKKYLQQKQQYEYSSNSISLKGPQPKPKTDKGITGLQNIGNTCFMNSALQCVFNVPQFNDYFLNGQYKSELKSNNKGIANAYAELLYNVRQRNNSRGESTYTLKRCIERISSQFQGYAQQDAQELLRVVLDGLHEDLNRIRKKPQYRELQADIKKRKIQEISDDWFNYYKDRDDSIVYDYFCGQMMNKVICTYCNNESLAFDNFLDLSLSFTKGLQRLQEFTLERLLDHFLKEEPLDDEYHCSNCKKGRKSNRKFEFYKMPNILVIHLKRFKFGRTTYGSSKLNQAIKFPITNLDLTQFIKSSKDKSCQDCIYDLTGVVNHSGSIYGGHYTADCMNPYDNRWYRFNDSHVSEINIGQQGYDTYGGSNPYILFYAKRKLIK